MGRTLLVTNDFPPRYGGIESFVYGLAERLDPRELIVYTSAGNGAAEFDRAQDFTVVRDEAEVLLPTRRVRKRAAQLARDHGCDTLWFGAAAPLGLIAGHVKRRSPVERAVALTHGHEAGWARLPVARGMLQRIARDIDVMTYLGDYTFKRLSPAVGDRTSLRRLAFGIDLERFGPAVDGSAVRAEWNIGGRPLVVCVSRLVPRKGQDRLIRALRTVRAEVPGARLMIVGEGPREPALRALAAEAGVEHAVVFTGGVEVDRLPEYYAAADVFAMPCFSRWSEFDVEGLGAVFLEAAASGRPVVAGDSGGAPEAVVDGGTGFVVGDEHALANRLTELLSDPAKAAELGARGREWTEDQWSWEVQAERFRRLLRGEEHSAPVAAAKQA
ncbi:glycosyltransferase family 4 protein [Salininema proteolyticum]|uniref:Glycosyltransferase family 4 protein n=1 Tax=Salininema proteolyticum TaxID=1607685 RepID=A0ABV8U301_9ACTN